MRADRIGRTTYEGDVRGHMGQNLGDTRRLHGR
jgi:hypothetical protein